MPNVVSDNLQSKHADIFLHEVSKRLPPPSLKAITMLLNTTDQELSTRPDPPNVNVELKNIIMNALDEAYMAYPAPQLINHKSSDLLIKNHIMFVISRYGLTQTSEDKVSRQVDELVTNFVSKITGKKGTSLDQEIKTMNEQFDNVCKSGRDSDWYIDFIGHLVDFHNVLWVKKECFELLVNALEEIGCPEFLRRYPSQGQHLIATIVDALNNNATLPPKILKEAVMMINSDPSLARTIYDIFGVRGFKNPSYMVKRQMDTLLTSVALLGEEQSRDVLFSISETSQALNNTQLQQLESGYLIDSITGELYDPNKSNSP